MSDVQRLGAWHGDQALRDEAVARMREHRAADSIVQGLYQKIDPDVATGYRGCAIGCLLPLQPMRGIDNRPWPSDGDDCLGWHQQAELEFGIPAAVAGRIDDVFECRAKPHHATFAVEVLEAIPVGADLSQVAEQFDEYLLTEASAYDDGAGDAAELIRLLSEAPVSAHG